MYAGVRSWAAGGAGGRGEFGEGYGGGAASPPLPVGAVSSVGLLRVVPPSGIPSTMSSLGLVYISKEYRCLSEVCRVMGESRPSGDDTLCGDMP